MGRPALSFLELAGYITHSSPSNFVQRASICPFQLLFPLEFLRERHWKIFYHFAHPTKGELVMGGLSPFIMVLRWHCSVWLATSLLPLVRFPLSHTFTQQLKSTLQLLSLVIKHWDWYFRLSFLPCLSIFQELPNLCHFREKLVCHHSWLETALPWAVWLY